MTGAILMTAIGVLGWLAIFAVILGIGFIVLLFCGIVEIRDWLDAKLGISERRKARDNRTESERLDELACGQLNGKSLRRRRAKRLR